jgi:hypothetical protein
MLFPSLRKNQSPVLGNCAVDSLTLMTIVVFSVEKKKNYDWELRPLASVWCTLSVIASWNLKGR